MATARRIFEVNSTAIVLGLAFFSCLANGAELHHRLGLSNRRSLDEATDGIGVTVFDVTQYDAKADDNTDNGEAFMNAWLAACQSGTLAKVVVPSGTYVTGPVVFEGPCNSTGPIVFEVQGYIKATTDLSEYSDQQWILFEVIDNLILTGGGTFDGQGATAWQYNDCRKNKDCVAPPDGIRFSKVNNSFVYGINSVNSKYFHFHVNDCNNITFHSMNITAPSDSPNTDGIHISKSSFVNITDSTIGTGDDCVSIGQGATNITISQIFCGPGHGLSVGSLGKEQNEENLGNVLVINCTLSNTTNGARIKTYPGSPPSLAEHITFQDIIMDHVKNPVIIDQKYGSQSNEPSQVKISDVHFKNIKGTSTSDVAVNLVCSSSVPCEGVELVDIDLSFVGRTGNGTMSSSCLNAKITASGRQNPTACI